MKFIYLFLTALIFAGASTANRPESELSFKFDFGNHWGAWNPIFGESDAKNRAFVWDPTFGATFGIEATVAKYFSLEGGLMLATFNASLSDTPWGHISHRSRTFVFGPRGAAKLLLPIEFETSKLVPYLGAALTLPTLSIVENSFGYGVGFDAFLGLKYLFHPRFGVLLELGTGASTRKSAPSFIFMPYRISSGLVVRL